MKRQLSQKTKNSVVIISTDNSRGSGFVVGHDKDLTLLKNNIPNVFFVQFL